HTLQSTSSVSASTVDIAGGTVSVNGTYAATSETQGESGGTINFNSAATVTGIGATLTAAGDAFNFNSGEAISPATMSLSGGTVGGTDTLNVSTLLTWTAGTMSGAGTTNVSGAMSIGGTGTKDLTSSRILNVSGPTTWPGVGQLRIGTGSSINNTGTWTCENDAPLETLNGTPAFHNVAPGTFRKLGGAGTTSVLMSFTNSGTVEALSGTLSFPNGYPQTAGTTTQNGGVLTSPTPLDIQGGVLQGSGPVCPPGSWAPRRATPRAGRGASPSKSAARFPGPGTTNSR